MLGGGDLNPLEQSQLILVEKSLFMRRTNLTFGQNGDEVKPLTTNEIKSLSEDERRSLSCFNLVLTNFFTVMVILKSFLIQWSVVKVTNLLRSTKFYLIAIAKIILREGARLGR